MFLISLSLVLCRDIWLWCQRVMERCLRIWQRCLWSLLKANSSKSSDAGTFWSNVTERLESNCQNKHLSGPQCLPAVMSSSTVHRQHAWCSNVSLWSMIFHQPPSVPVIMSCRMLPCFTFPGWAKEMRTIVTFLDCFQMLFFFQVSAKKQMTKLVSHGG